MTNKTIPAPPRPTLAEMTDEQRRACRWMLCDVENVEDRAIIVDPCREDGTARVVWPGALNEPPIDWEKVTPRPDVARMTWPGAEKPAPDLPEANDTNLPYPMKGWVLDADGSPIVWTAPAFSVMVHRIEPGNLTPDQARAFALALFAAAAYSEGTTDD